MQLKQPLKNVIDVSGQYNGGEIRTIAKKSNKISGKLIANSSQIGGKVDITAEKVEVESAKIEAKGNLQGGKIRVGGDYLGGNLTNLDKNIKQGFVSRFGDQPQLANSKQMVVKADANIDVSSSAGKGGTAVIWSDEMTDFNGTINAKGADLIQVTSNLGNTNHIDSKSDPPKKVIMDRRTFNFVCSGSPSSTVL